MRNRDHLMDMRLVGFIRRLAVFLIGMFIMALGVGAAVKSNLGISPVNSIPYVLSRVTVFEQGRMTPVVFCVFIMLQILLLKKDFPLLQLFQIAIAAVFGFFVTWANRIWAPVMPQSYLFRLFLTLLSVLLISIGVFLYLSAKLIPQPMEGLCLAIEKKSGWQYSNIKICSDCTLVAIAALISYIGCGRIVGIREGTVITMVSVGKILDLFNRLWKEKLLRLLMM